MTPTTKRFLLAYLIPAVPAAGVFAANLLTGGTPMEDPVRFCVALLVFAGIWGGGSYLLGRHFYQQSIATRTTEK